MPLVPFSQSRICFSHESSSAAAASFSMPVYVVAAILHRTRPEGFLELWTRAIKGPYDHVEIAFINGRDVFACYITRKSMVAQFVRRSYYDMLQMANVFWFRLPNISREAELELEHKCRRIVGKGDLYQSSTMQVMSAFPIRNEQLVRSWMPIIEPPPPPDPDETEEERKWDEETRRSAWSVHPRMTFCGALSAEILGFEDPAHCTASDVVVLAQRHLNAKLEKKPVQDMDPRIQDDANIVRSSMQPDASFWNELV